MPVSASQSLRDWEDQSPGQKYTEYCDVCGIANSAKNNGTTIELRPHTVSYFKGDPLIIGVCGECHGKLLNPDEIDREDFYIKLKPVMVEVVAMRSPNPMQLKEIASELNNRGWRTLKGSSWTESSVFKTLDRLEIDRTLQHTTKLPVMGPAPASELPAGSFDWMRNESD